MPSQKQLRWSELRVGITVIFALVTLAVLVFLMRGTTGFFTSRITLITYFSNAEGLRGGQPVDLQGVAIGNVQSVSVTNDPQHADLPIKVVLRIKTKFQPFVREDAKATIQTQGVLGESFVDIDNTGARGAPVMEGAVLRSTNAPDLQDVVRSSQSTLQNLQVLVKRVDGIVAEIEGGRGSLGKFINDPIFFDRATQILNQVQAMLNDVSEGKGTIGKLLTDESLANRLSDDVDKLSDMVDDINSGKGNLGLLIKDDTFMKNANQTVVKVNRLVDDVNAGHGTLGKLAKDEELANKLKETIDKLSSVADRLEAGQGSAGQFLKNPSFYNNSDQLLVESRNLVKAIREDPKKYLTIHLRVF
ncbi:MAG TPA: MlaD family protein [Candidatus Angelobacter sp.]|nr:MlaD family protein [Candidatus Angelobacter sp.]